MFMERRENCLRDTEKRVQSVRLTCFPITVWRLVNVVVFMYTTFGFNLL